MGPHTGIEAKSSTRLWGGCRGLYGSCISRPKMKMARVLVRQVRSWLTLYVGAEEMENVKALFFYQKRGQARPGLWPARA